MRDLTFVLGHGEEADIGALAHWHKERRRFSVGSNRGRGRPTGYLHPLDGLDGVVGDVDVDANGLAVVVQLE